MGIILNRGLWRIWLPKSPGCFMSLTRSKRWVINPEKSSRMRLIFIRCWGIIWRRLGILREPQVVRPEAGGESLEAGGESPKAGGESPKARGESPEAGGESPEAGGESPEAVKNILCRVGILHDSSNGKQIPIIFLLKFELMFLIGH